jgi:hypothetical protein
MIFLTNGVTNLRTLAFFSTKRADVETELLPDLSLESDFCTCVTQCVPALKVFASDDGDFYKNDKTTLFIRTLNVISTPSPTYSNTTGTINNVKTGVKTPLVDGIHGQAVPVNNFYYFIVDWLKIKNVLGLGNYKIEATTTAVLGGQTIDYFCSPKYKLMEYSDKLANGTVRLEIQQEGRLNHSYNYSNLKGSFGKSVIYSNQIRLPGSLKFEAMNEETDHLTLNGSSRPSYQIKDQARPSYSLSFHLVSSEQVIYTLFNDLFANPVKVSDYNVYNFVADVDNYSAEKYRSLPLIKESTNFEPTAKQKRKSFNFTMKYFNDKIFKTNN